MGCKSGEHCIEPYNGRGDLAGIQIGWRVILPSKFIPKVSIKYFSFTKFGSTSNALKAAINYRNYIVETRLKEL